MKLLLILSLTVILHVSLMLHGASSSMWTRVQEVVGPYDSTLTTKVGESKLVVLGTVIDKQFVWDAFHREPATEITVTAGDVIKGTPNASDGSVKFMVSGGEAVDPRSGELIKKKTQRRNEFEIGEKVFFFLNQMYKSSAAYKAHPYDGIYIGPYGKVSITDDTVRLPLLGHDVKDVALPVDLVILLGKATVIDRETAMMIELSIQQFVWESDTVELSEKLLERLMFTCENLLRGYEQGVESAMELVKLGESDSIVTHSSQTHAQEKGYCRGFVDTMRRHFDADYYCICNRHWSYQIERPEK